MYQNRFFLIFLMSCLVFSSLAQGYGYLDGTIITNERDTLKGSIKVGETNIRIQIKGEEKRRSYSHSDVLSYSLYGGGFYFRFDGNFYQRVLTGEVNLYKRVVQDHYTSSDSGPRRHVRVINWAVQRLNDDDLTLIRKTYENTLATGYGKKFFRKTASNFFSDSDEIVKEIKSGRYDYDQGTMSLVQRYNIWFTSKNGED